MKLLIILVCTFHQFTNGFNDYPFERRIIFPFQTYGPVSLQSKYAKPINVPPIRIDVHPSATIMMNKTLGVRTRLRGTPIDDRPTISITGGVVFDDEYIFNRFTYLVDGVPYNGHVGGMIDGESPSLEYGILFLKKSYQTVENAINYADGIISLVIPITVSEWGGDNPDFVGTEKILYRMRSSNATTPIYVSVEEALVWLLKSLTKYNAFYSYPVTFENNLNPGQSLKQCMIRLQPAAPPREYLTVSKRQFDQYLHVLNYNGKPLTNTLTTFPIGKRPLVKAYTRVILHFK